MKRTICHALIALVLAACKSPSAPPAERPVTVSVVGGDVIYGATNVALPEPLQVVVVDEVTKAPVRGVTVRWRVMSGSGRVIPEESTTDVDGVAETNFQQAALGTHRVRASADRFGNGPEFEIRIVPVPQITSIEPAVVTPGGTVVVRGSNFSPIADHNAVLFDGVRGTIESASQTELRVIVPLCLPNGSLPVAVALGFAESGAAQVQVTGAGGTTLMLEPGASHTFSDAAELSCIRLPGGISSALYLLTAHNVGSVHTAPLRFELRSPTAAAVTNVVGAPAPGAGFAEAWEMRLRQRERALLQAPLEEGAAAFAPSARLTHVPQVGERASFNVLTPNNTFQTVAATARVVSARAVIYLDDDAPANGFTNQDLQSFADLFDDPIYATDVAIFGEPSDIDGNERITILFTPRINALTPEGSTSSFAAGYFYGCDLLPRARCSGSNLGEIFYALVPDPTGQWNNRRTVEEVLRVVPPVLAHELQHMIHFARRGLSTDALWLSEALAHTAEDLVGDALQAQGAADAVVASFKSPNYGRARRYLGATAEISLLAEDLPGSLELRGAAWLFMKHLRGHYGGNDLLTRLTASTRSGVANVTQETQRPWSTLVRDFGVAIWADGAPEFPAGTQPQSPQHVFSDFDLRAVLREVGGFPLSPPSLAWASFSETGSIASASQTHFRLVAPPDGGADLRFVFSGPRGAPFDASSTAHFTILRAR